MKNYSEKLKDPRWQKRRLEIMNRDNFTCRICGCGIADGKPLNVHHISYKSNLEPWDYPDEMLVTLCEACHQSVHKEYGAITKEAVEPFFFTYPKFLDIMFSTNVLNTPSKVLYKLLSFAEYNTNKVIIDSEKVNNILKTCGISRTSYHRAINDLIKENVIVKNKNVYTINAKMFWKGDRKHRHTVLIPKEDEIKKEQDD